MAILTAVAMVVISDMVDNEKKRFAPEEKGESRK